MKSYFLIIPWFVISLSAGNLNIFPTSKPIEIKNNKLSYINNFYFGLGFGKVKISSPLEELKSNTLSLTLGYTINPYLSLEARYTKSIEDLEYKSKTKSKDIDSTYSNLALFSKLSYPIHNFKPYILLGYGKNKITKLAKTTRDENSFEYGAGLEYKINSNFSINLDYIRAYNKKGFDNRAIDQRVKIDLITASLTYNF